MHEVRSKVMPVVLKIVEFRFLLRRVIEQSEVVPAVACMRSQVAGSDFLPRPNELSISSGSQI